MGRIIFVILAVIGVILAVLLFAPGIIPAATYKDRIETAASTALSRDVAIGDDLSIRIFPRTAFRVGDLAIANAEGFEGETLARVKEASIGVKLLPLLSGSVEVDRFVLIEPAINLVRKADGSVNWNLAAPSEPDAAPAESGEATAPRDLKLGDVRIENGRATYRDEGSGQSFAAEKINVSVLLKSLREPLEIRGDLVFQGEPTDLNLVLTDLKTLMDGEAANMKLDATIGETRAGADIAVTSGEALRYEGPIEFAAPDLPAFAALVGAELADAPGFDSLSLSGEIDGAMDGMRLSNAVIGFDEIDAQGALDLDWSGEKPKASGILSTELLDLRPYMPPPTETSEGFPAWSEAKMDFSALNNIDASFDVSAEEILLNDLKVGESRLKLNIENGRMTADIPELAMYGGQGSGRLVVNARSATPSFAGNFDMEAVNAQPLSVDLMKHDNLLGIGGFKLDFTASGASQAAIMNSLDGSGGFDLADGALKGVNIAKIIAAANDVRQGGVNPTALATAVATARGPREETDFTEFVSAFSMTDGLVSVPTISMTGPYLTMKGAGEINLAGQTIDLRLAPKGATTIDGEEGKSLTVPLRVGGTFSKPSLSIDAEALAKAALSDELGGFLGDASSPEEAAAGAIRSILGGGAKDETTDAEATTDEETTSSPEEDLIKQGLGALFGKKKTDDEDEDDNN